MSVVSPLLMFIGGVVLFLLGAEFAIMSMFDTSGYWWIRPLGYLCALVALFGLIVIARSFGIGYVGAP